MEAKVGLEPTSTALQTVAYPLCHFAPSRKILRHMDYGRDLRPASGVTMAVKSKAQRRKFAQLLVEGKIKPEAYERWNREAGKRQLPERVARKKKRKSKRGTARKRR
jgi:hypothetical protein